MPLVVRDRVKETSITAGTGTLTLDGAVAGFQSFASIGNGNTTYYTIVDNIANTWEVGVGTYTSLGTTLSRDTVLANSLGTTALINFASNSKDVFVTYPAGRSVYSDGTNITPATAATVLTTSGGTGLSSYTAGDLPYFAAGTAFTKLPIGAAGRFLTSTGTAPQWSDPTGVAVTSITFGTTGLTPATATQGAVTVAGTLITSNGGTGLSSYTAGDLPYYAAGTSLTKLGIGAANTVMTSSGSAPQWSTSISLTTVTAQTVVASNGIFVNGATVSTSYSIPSGSNAMSAGVITIANGVTVTVPDGSRWTVI
jgi:hypothetical protein